MIVSLLLSLSKILFEFEAVVIFLSPQPFLPFATSPVLEYTPHSIKLVLSFSKQKTLTEISHASFLRNKFCFSTFRLFRKWRRARGKNTKLRNAPRGGRTNPDIPEQTSLRSDLEGDRFPKMTPRVLIDRWIDPPVDASVHGTEGSFMSHTGNRAIEHEVMGPKRKHFATEGPVQPKENKDERTQDTHTLSCSGLRLTSKMLNYCSSAFRAVIVTPSTKLSDITLMLLNA